MIKRNFSGLSTGEWINFDGHAFYLCFCVHMEFSIHVYVLQFCLKNVELFLKALLYGQLTKNKDYYCNVLLNKILYDKF